MCNEFEIREAMRLEYEKALEGVGAWDDAPPGPPDYDETEPGRGPDWEPVYRLMKPSMAGEIIRFNDRGRLEVASARWGLVPRFWTGTVKDWITPTRGGKKISMPWTNAKSETVAKVSAFAPSYKDRRCLVPASAYVEYKGEGTPKPRFRFTVGNHDLFMMAGLWDAATPADRAPEDGPLQSFTILTTDPGPDAAQYHTRQPVILRPDQYGAWLDPANDMAPGFAGGSPAGLLNIVAAPRKKAA